ncbi:MAG: hypothetical protein GY781_13300 [Gammaproteobacteria bacterium]|nr:hypothetical protein [Gammaproteobacteria bacterium]MCP4414428.1 hypothetical protein [Gammaproteobacteria bacterium]
MTIKGTKLRLMTITLQLIAGISLLVFSYLTTEAGWADKLIQAATHQQQIELNKCA